MLTEIGCRERDWSVLPTPCLCEVDGQEIDWMSLGEKQENTAYSTSSFLYMKQKS